MDERILDQFHTVGASVWDVISPFFGISYAVEYLTSEALMSSLYRSVGMSGFSDKFIALNGIDVTKMLEGADRPDFTPFDIDDVRRILQDIIISPQDGGKDHSTFKGQLFLAPIIPYVAYFSNPVRLSAKPNGASGNAWNAPEFIKIMVSSASHDNDDMKNLWDTIFKALSVEQPGKEDSFAILLDQMFSKIASSLKDGLQDGNDRIPAWMKSCETCSKMIISPEDRKLLAESTPFETIRTSLYTTMSMKPMFSRWQWLTMVDAALRLSVTSYMVWLLNMHNVMRLLIYDVFIMRNLDAKSLSKEQFAYYCKAHIDKSDRFGYYEPVSSVYNKMISRYAADMQFIGFFLSYVQSKGFFFYQNDWSDIQSLINTFKRIDESDIFDSDGIAEFNALHEEMCARPSSPLLVSSSRRKHLGEFFKLIYRKSVVASKSDFIRYDQSYMSCKRGSYKSAPYIIDLGSVACFVVASCAANGKSVYSYKKFEKFMRDFSIDIGESCKARVQEKLKGLGLTLDSPDAEDGLMVVNPFKGE